ncbi:unnamed protein product [Eruca vesicaria subsp. sativa]|uniref:Uncharacterized protein n=1 Tax=Eruca vesicaria subsp. sativa TaxID=29727 RepID=A0ABC8LL49_ERUVS|nr:unnamed protein product [Eruca vesicaria subsp. sativa]
MLSTTDAELLMSVHEWNTYPELYLVFRAEDVAKYQFICRAPFTIGRFRFLGDGVTEEQHMATISEMMRNTELKCSAQIHSDVYNEEKLVLIYHFSMELEKPKNSIDLNVGADADMSDHMVPNVDYNADISQPIPELLPFIGMPGYGMRQEIGESSKVGANVANIKLEVREATAHEQE